MRRSLVALFVGTCPIFLELAWEEEVAVACTQMNQLPQLGEFLPANKRCYRARESLVPKNRIPNAIDRYFCHYQSSHDLFTSLPE